jgi:hypothetical protein
MKIEDAIGKWCLVRKSADWFGKPQQAKIIEISPSGKYIRFKFIHQDFSEWIEVGNLKILEILE